MRVFISYRRSDAAAASRQLAEALRRRFGTENVFLDTNDLGVGEPWPTVVSRRVRDADVVLAVIGPRWVTLADEHGRRALVDSREEDAVRMELEVAFRNRSLVIPVLVDEADMPPPQRLPRPFRPLASLQAATLRHASWDRDVEVLLGSLQHRVTAIPDAPQPPQPGNGLPPGRYADLVRYTRDGSLVAV